MNKGATTNNDDPISSKIIDLNFYLHKSSFTTPMSAMVYRTIKSECIERNFDLDEALITIGHQLIGLNMLRSLNLVSE